MALDIHPNDFAEIAIILARGYVRHRDSTRQGFPNCLASAAERSPHVPVVNETENRGETDETKVSPVSLVETGGSLFQGSNFSNGAPSTPFGRLIPSISMDRVSAGRRKAQDRW